MLERTRGNAPISIVSSDALLELFLDSYCLEGIKEKSTFTCPDGTDWLSSACPFGYRNAPDTFPNDVNDGNLHDMIEKNQWKCSWMTSRLRGFFFYMPIPFGQKC
ncbi:hypothetical protein Tco_0647698 [Tanacetum coccineum]